MNTIDFNQLVDDLKEKLGHCEILQRAGIKKLSPDDLQASFEAIQNLLDLHLDVCPELHKPNVLFFSR